MGTRLTELTDAPGATGDVVSDARSSAAHGSAAHGSRGLRDYRTLTLPALVEPRVSDPLAVGASRRREIGAPPPTVARTRDRIAVQGATSAMTISAPSRAVALPGAWWPGTPRAGTPPSATRRRRPLWLVANAAVLLVALLAVGIPHVLQANAESACRWHTVAPGDTLGDLGWQYHSSALAIARANHIRNPNLIYVSQRLCVPTIWYAQAHAAPAVPKHAAPAVPAAAFSATVLGGKVAAPDNAAHYTAKYGFDRPGAPQRLSSGERQRLVAMLPFAVAATARFNQRYGYQMEPQLLLYWTHAEGIGARVSYSNCANERPPRGQNYFTYITNCGDPSFWQLGYGNQFSVIPILRTAFLDMHGNPNDPRLVQRVGQAVLNADMAHGTTPRCGGYSCTFPALTIDQIMAGVSLRHQTTNDWWASVLSRDPAINSYMVARALTWFNHNATRTWVGCYYAEPCWGYESNRLGDILAAWPSLRAAAGV
jgi:hypothetical protein